MLLYQSAITIADKFYVTLAGLLCLFQEAVQHIHGLLKFGDIHDPENVVITPYAYFMYSLTYRSKRLPVVRPHSLLNQVKLIP